MNDVMFKASGFAALEPALVDDQVVAVLSQLTAPGWQRVAHVPLTAPVHAARVDVSGPAQDSVMVRMGEHDAGQLAARLAPGEPVSALETVAELANLLAGHLKGLLADAMATGIPVTYPKDPGPLNGYRSVFRNGELTVEVSAHG